MKLLLVDDEPGIREGLAMLLRLRGHEVRTAATVAAGEAALADQDFDLVLTDWRLPDGVAAPLLAAATCPVVAISGHPEEVAGGGSLWRVLAKPVLPARVLELLAEVDAGAGAATSRDPLEALPADVREVVERAVALVGGAATIVDDGSFVTLRAPWPRDAGEDAFEALGGDLRVLAPGDRPVVEIRWCRDGRHELHLPVLGPDEPWPTAGDFAVDFHDTEVLPGLVVDYARAARALRRDGRFVQLLNVPAAVRAAIAVSDRDADLPMRDRIGPRLPAALAELWS